MHAHLFVDEGNSSTVARGLQHRIRHGVDQKPRPEPSRSCGGVKGYQGGTARVLPSIVAWSKSQVIHNNWHLYSAPHFCEPGVATWVTIPPWF